MKTTLGRRNLNTTNIRIEVSEPSSPIPRGAHLSRSAPSSSLAAKLAATTTTTSTTTTTTTSSSDTPTSPEGSLFARARMSLRGSRRERPASTSYGTPSSAPLIPNTAPPLWLPLVDFLCRQVELLGKSKVGIFRTSASAHTVRQLLKACEALHAKRSGEDEMELLFAPYIHEVDVLASVLKGYLREQSQPFIPMNLYDAFLSASEIKDIDERLFQLGILVSQLSRYRRRILQRFMISLHQIQENQSENKMDASNLAIVFAPSLLRSEDEGLDMSKIRAQCYVIENCILYHAVVFQDGNYGTCNDEDDEEEDKRINGPHEEDNRGATTLTEHQFKKEGFNPFHHVACMHCNKSIRSIGKAYQCQGCGSAVHSKCRQHVGQTCTGVASGREKHATPRQASCRMSLPVGSILNDNYHAVPH